MDVLDGAGVDAGALDQPAEDTREQVLRGRVFEAAAAALGLRGAECARYHHVVRVLLGELVSRGGTRGELFGDLGKAGRGWTGGGQLGGGRKWGEGIQYQTY